MEIDNDLPTCIAYLQISNEKHDSNKVAYTCKNAYISYEDNGRYVHFSYVVNPAPFHCLMVATESSKECVVCYCFHSKWYSNLLIF